MSLHAVVTLQELEAGLILAPERYDPRRYTSHGARAAVADVVSIVAHTISPTDHVDRQVVVLNTGDARDGLITVESRPVSVAEIGSTKKLIQRGDVIVSRLRPYLRQVAYVDQGLVQHMPAGATLACSTEFYVLRSRSDESIAFLAPFLLSDQVQAILQASQEGGHHPRFGQLALERIAIPDQLLARRQEISAAFESAVDAARGASTSMRRLAEHCTQLTRDDTAS